MGSPVIESTTTIRAPADYVFACRCSGICKVPYHGHDYRAHRFVLDVPCYTDKVLVECLTGPDAGLWFTVSLDNFARRYEPLPEPVPTDTPLEKAS